MPFDVFLAPGSQHIACTQFLFLATLSL